MLKNKDIDNQDDELKPLTKEEALETLEQFRKDLGLEDVHSIKERIRDILGRSGLQEGGAPAYKAALNVLTRKLAAELRGTGILVNSSDPGWLATDMGGPGRGPVEEGANGIVWAATLPNDGPSGGFFYGQGEPRSLVKSNLESHQASTNFRFSWNSKTITPAADSGEVCIFIRLLFKD